MATLKQYRANLARLTKGKTLGARRDANKVTVKLTVPKARVLNPVLVLEEFFSDANVQLLIDEFLLKIFIPFLEQQYWAGGRTVANFGVKADTSGTAKRSAERAERDTVGESVSGKINKRIKQARSTTEQLFQEVWNTLKVRSVENNAGQVFGGVGPGQKLLNIKLLSFSKRPDPTEFDKAFWAIEMGTGIKENTGIFLRETSELTTKSKTDPGAWYTGGVKWLGQRGFHFLWDQNTGDHLPVYDAFIREQLPIFINKKLRLALTGSST